MSEAAEASTKEVESHRIHPARRSSLAKEITEQLFELIISGAFPNDRLPPERVPCEQLGDSRGPREALSTLTHLNVLETRGKAKYGRKHRARMHLMTRMPAGSTERGCT